MFARYRKAVERSQLYITVAVFVLTFLSEGALVGVIFAVGTFSGLYATTQLARLCYDAANRLTGGLSDGIFRVSIIFLALALIAGPWFFSLLLNPWQDAAYRYPVLHVAMTGVCGLVLTLGTATMELLLLYTVLNAWALARAIHATLPRR